MYLAGIILVLSLFLDIKQADVNYIRIVCFVAIVLALGTWVLKAFIDNLNMGIYEHYIQNNKDMKKYYKIIMWLINGFFLIQFILWFAFIAFVVL
ncbi:MAG: hypothetical protein ABIF40_00695 [archaeon]